MFNEKKKWKVHKVLAMRFARDASVATNEKPRKRADPGISENSDSPTIDGLKETSLDEYLGLFEIAYMLIKNNNLDKMLFFKTYSYRINYLAKDPAIIKKLVKEAGMWANLNALIAMNEKWLRK